ITKELANVSTTPNFNKPIHYLKDHKATNTRNSTFNNDHNRDFTRDHRVACHHHRFPQQTGLDLHGEHHNKQTVPHPTATLTWQTLSGGPSVPLSEAKVTRIRPPCSGSPVISPDTCSALPMRVLCLLGRMIYSTNCCEGQVLLHRTRSTVRRHAAHAQWGAGTL